MHARSLLDYLSDAEHAQMGGRRDARDWASILDRLRELELRLGDLRNASETRETVSMHREASHQDLRDEISSILRRRGVTPQARRASPPPPLAPRDWVEPPPLAPVQAFHGPAERADPNLVKFIEAVRLLGRAADRFVTGSDAPSDGAFDTLQTSARSGHPPPQPSMRPRQRPIQAEHMAESAAPRVTDADLLRLWEEVEELRRTLSHLSSRGDSY